MNYNNNASAVSVTRNLVVTLINVADGLMATALGALIVNMYLGDLSVMLNMTLYSAFATLLLVSVWMKGIVA